MKKLVYIILMASLLGLSCRSHKESAVAESLFKECDSSAHSNEKLTNVSNWMLNSVISFDSIEILIKRNWNSIEDENSRSHISRILDTGIVANPDSIRDSSKLSMLNPYSEIIGIKAYNAKSATAFLSQDSLARSNEYDSHESSIEESQKEQTAASGSVAMWDPPDLKTVLIWAVIIASAIYILVRFLKKKARH